jgi:hypothetical protein
MIYSKDDVKKMLGVLKGLPRYDHTIDYGCGDPDCCGASSTVVSDPEGTYVRYESLIELIEKIESSL